MYGKKDKTTSENTNNYQRVMIFLLVIEGGKIIRAFLL